MITTSFPKLSDCGGFELLRCVANSKHLDVIVGNIAQIPSPSPTLLMTIIGNARVYIRPIQTDLDLAPTQTTSSPEVL